MAQIFTRAADLWLRVWLLAGCLFVVGGGFVLAGIVRSDYATGENTLRQQPVPFSHKHHVGGLGIDCRYCHQSAETSAEAGFPATEVCMSCHSQIWTEADPLAPVRESLADGVPLRWRRVNALPAFVYFDHSAHLANGVGCETCHGRVDRMPLTRKAHSLSMGWCLDCHREPASRLRPPEALFAMGWAEEGPPSGRDTEDAGQAALMRRYGIETRRLNDCYTCHR